MFQVSTKAKLMIERIQVGDITDGKLNPRDIIIGMNTEMLEASAIGRPFVKKVVPLKLLALGSVLTFQFDKKRKLHMIICHHHGEGGWRGAAQYVRFGMDYLWQREEDGQRNFSIVQIGHGPVGRRDGADFSKIIRAISESSLPVVLYVRNPEIGRVEIPQAKNRINLQFEQGWSPDSGLHKVAVHA